MQEPGFERVPRATSLTAPVEPPHPLDADWVVSVGGSTYGPYTGHQLAEYVKEGRVTADTAVRASGSDRWITAREDIVLRQFFSPPAPRSHVESPPPPQMSARDGGTVVHVSNNMTMPNPALLADLGIVKDKSPVVALILSILFVGLGQLYNGQIGKGFLMFFGSLLLWAIMLGWVIWIWSIIDAYSVAKTMSNRYRRMVAGMPA